MIWLIVALRLNLLLLKVVSRWTGIPVTSLDAEETEKLIHLADRLHERVVGQNEAVNLVVQAVLRSRAGLERFLGLNWCWKDRACKSSC